MAAAVVPSRARAARNAPPASDVTFVRMNLIIDHLQGDLQPEPKYYFFRWIRAGKDIKVTAAKPANTAPFAGEMAQYASVRRHGPVFVSNDPSEPLDTQLVLVITEPNGEPTVVSTVAFDIAYYLNAIVEAGAKTLPTTIQMPGSITLSITLVVKTLGGDHLQRYVPERPLGLAPSESSDMDEAAAALELERLRQEVREKEHRLGALEQSTDSLQDAVRRAQPGADAAALSVAQVRVKELEEKLATTDREKAEAQRRVSAHMTHAVKIRETYERLAVWYNDLRQEHSELRKKYEEQAAASADTSERSLVGVGSSQESDLQNLREERDKLQAELMQEQTEKSEMHSRNSQLLETKARALAELRDQWDSAQNNLVATTKENEEKAKALEELHQTIGSLRSQLLERSATLEEKSAELEEAIGRIQKIEESHSTALESVKRETSEETRSLVASETDQLRKQHQEELQQLNEKLQAEMEASMQVERQKFDVKRTKEHEAVREQLVQEHESQKSEEIAALIADHENRLKEEKERSQQKVLELKNEYESQLAAKERVTDELRNTHAKEMQDMAKGRDDLDSELVSPRNASVAAALQDECTRLRTELESVLKENEEMRTSPRAISTATEGSDMEQAAERLNGEIAELEALLRAQTKERSETVKQLANAEREHDELREMVTRIRSERDTALRKLKQARDAVPNPEIRHSAVQRNVSRERRSPDTILAEGERDKAIRELFRVRKNMNKEIRRLKKENEELTIRPATEPSPDEVAAERELSVEVTKVTGERDSALSDLEAARRELEAANSSLSAERESASAKSAQVDDLRKRLKSAEADVAALHDTVNELQESLAMSRKENAERVAKDTEAKEKILNELNATMSAKTAAEAALRNKEEKLASLTTELDSASRSLAGASRGNEEMARERDSARNKSAALATELETLKKSLNAMSSSSSSTDTMLREAQARVAESKAEVKLLRSELDDLRTEAETKETKREEEALSFEASISQQRSLLDNERVAKDELVARTTELEGLVATLSTKNESLGAKLGAEQGMKDDAEKRVADAEKSLGRLRQELSQVRANELAGAEAVGRANAEREQTDRSLTDMTQRLQLLEQSLNQKNSEVVRLQKKLGMAEAAVDALESESSKASEDGKAVWEELQAVRAELTHAQNELRQKSQQLDSEITKGSAQSQQETAAVRDLTGLSENLRAENANLLSRLETAQDELRTMEDAYSSMESKLQSVEREGIVRDRSIADYNRLREAHRQLKEDMDRAGEEAVKSNNEKSALSTQLQRLQRDLDSLRNEMLTMRNENEGTLAEERASKEQEAAKSIELRKELRSARALVESLQAEVEQVKAENGKLSKDKGEAQDSHVLGELIKMKIELAYAQEEAVRLRNKLKKVGLKGQGSASFEY